jgi:hypothetical protein
MPTKPIDGNVPPKEPRSQRVKILASMPGATLKVEDDFTVIVTAETDEYARLVRHRVHHACALIGILEYTWDVTDKDARIFRVTLT